MINAGHKKTIGHSLNVGHFFIMRLMGGESRNLKILDYQDKSDLILPLMMLREGTPF